MTTNNDLDQAREWAKWIIRADSQVEVDPDLRGAAEVIQSLPDEWIDADKFREVIEEYDSGESGAFIDDLRALLPAPAPRTLADTKWDDSVHPYMEAVTASGRRHIMLAQMGYTAVSENTILVAEHGGGVPVLVPADALTPTGRYARLSLPDEEGVDLRKAVEALRDYCWKNAAAAAWLSNGSPDSLEPVFNDLADMLTRILEGEETNE